MNPTIITGWIATILLFFNFATCLAMPWANKRFSECGDKDCENKECEAITLCKYHKPIVFLSILAMIIHIIVSLLN